MADTQRVAEVSTRKSSTRNFCNELTIRELTSTARGEIPPLWEKYQGGDGAKSYRRQSMWAAGASMMFQERTAPSKPWLITASRDSRTYSGEVGATASR